MLPFRSIIEMMDTLHTEEEYREYLETLLWGDAPVCPHCGTVDKNHYRLTSFGRHRSHLQKTPVFGMVSDGKVYARVTPDATKDTLQSIIDELANVGIRIISDCWRGYNDVHKKFIHEKVAHSLGECVNERGFHTNTIEGFWSILKRSIIGIYQLVISKHLPEYCKEFVYRYNTRKLTDGERFIECLRTPSRRLSYGEICMKSEYIEQLLARQEDMQYRRECEHMGLRCV